MEPRGYYDPPSEREPTLQELEEFFSDKNKDAHMPNAPAGNPVTLDSIQQALAEFDALYPRPDQARPVGIYITHITPPPTGWPIALYCPICRETTFILSPWAKKPDDGDYWRINRQCAYALLGQRHTMAMARMMGM